MSSIVLQTSKKRSVVNFQNLNNTYTLLEQHEHQKLVEKHPFVQIRTNKSKLYNCHGLTFAGKRTAVEKETQVNEFITDDLYGVVNRQDVLAGDIILYYDGNEIIHSGVVVEKPNEMKACKVLSKWGDAMEAVHMELDCPYQTTKIEFRRCQL